MSKRLERQSGQVEKGKGKGTKGTMLEHKFDKFFSVFCDFGRKGKV